MKIFDYVCEGCERKFEVFLDADDQEVECPTPKCNGNVVRQLGGKPAFTSSRGESYEGPHIDQQGNEVTHETMLHDSVCIGDLPDGSHAHLEVKITRKDAKP